MPRRLIKRVVLYALLGAVTTVAVAWAPVFIVPDRFDEISHDCRTPGDDPAFIYASRSATSTNHMLMLPTEDQKKNWPACDSLPSWSHYSAPKWRDKKIGAEHARGWPSRCLLAYDTLEDTTRPSRFTTHAGVEVSNKFILASDQMGLPLTHHLPLQPIPAGFAIDTAIYACAWFVVFATPRHTRRALRRRKGRCPMCAYDLNAAFAVGCPECGWNR